jgi:hypothetical protein
MCNVLSADMSCQGQVVYTGGSSLDIRMEAQQVLGQTLCATSCLLRHAAALVNNLLFGMDGLQT